MSQQFDDFIVSIQPRQATAAVDSCGGCGGCGSRGDLGSDKNAVAFVSDHREMQDTASS